MSDILDLGGRVALVTGAGQGVGEQRFYERLRDAKDMQEILVDARTNGYKPGEQRAFVMALVLAGCAAMVTLWRKDKGTVVLLAGHGLVLLMVYAQLENWRGGRSYGPRYLVPAMPLVCSRIRSMMTCAFGRSRQSTNSNWMVPIVSSVTSAEPRWRSPERA